jgi:hypothetical protein
MPPPLASTQPGAIASGKMHNYGHRGLQLGVFGGVGMPSSGIINLAIGLVLVFGATAALASAATEAVARLCGLRGAFLLRGLRELLDGSQASADLGPAEESYLRVKGLITGQRAATDARAAADAKPDNKQLQDAALAAEAAQAKLAQPTDRSLADAANPGSAVPAATSALLGSPILRSRGMASQGMTLRPPREPGRLPELVGSGSRLWRQCRSLPPYIPAESFAGAVMDLVVPDATEEITMATVRQDVDALPDEMTAFKPSLQALVKSAGNDVGVFRTSVARWFDNQMDHVSREYKGHVGKITLVAGLIIVLLFNVNALVIGRYLYSDFSVNSAVSSVATKDINCPPNQSSADCLANLRAELSFASQLGLPVGWTTVPDCFTPYARCNWLDQHGIFSRHGSSGWQLVLYLIGLALTVLALLPGARFWFNLLTRLRNVLGV